MPQILSERDPGAKISAMETNQVLDPLGLFEWRDGQKDFSRCHMALDLLNGLSSEELSPLSNEEVQTEAPTAQ
jgi:hypothetical protein